MSALSGHHARIEIFFGTCIQNMELHSEGAGCPLGIAVPLSVLGRADEVIE